MGTIERLRGYVLASATFAGFGFRGVWLVVVYWVTVGLAVMLLGAHQFHLKVAANAAANPQGALTIGELISKQHEYRILQDAIGSRQREQEVLSAEVARRRQEMMNAMIEEAAATAEGSSAARALGQVVLENPESRKELPPGLLMESPGKIVSMVGSFITTDATKRLFERYEKARSVSEALTSRGIAAKRQLELAQLDLDKIPLELKVKTDALNTFLTSLDKPSTPPARSGGLSTVSLLYELDSFNNLRFFWLGLADPLKFVTLPGSVLTLLLAIAMGALGSTLFVTGEYFGAATARPFAWYFFRPFLGMITALAVFIAFKAGQLTISGVSPNSGIEMDLNPFLVSFFAVIGGLLSEHAIKRLSLIGADWLDRLGKEKEAKDANAPASQAGDAVEPLFAKEWEARFADGSGASFDGLVEALHADPASVTAWIQHREAVPPEAVSDLVKYFGVPKEQLVGAGDR